jgi:hypothetical protein
MFGMVRSILRIIDQDVTDRTIVGTLDAMFPKLIGQIHPLHFASRGAFMSDHLWYHMSFTFQLWLKYGSVLIKETTNLLYRFPEFATKL